MEAKKFKNFSAEDFGWKFNGVPFTFKAGQEVYLEAEKADHFARHLINRELDKKGMKTDNKLARADMEKLCFPGDALPVEEALDLEEKKKELDRVAVKSFKKGKKKVEEEFPDLNQDEK